MAIKKEEKNSFRFFLMAFGNILIDSRETQHKRWWDENKGMKNLIQNHFMVV